MQVKKKKNRKSKAQKPFTSARTHSIRPSSKVTPAAPATSFPAHSPTCKKRKRRTTKKKEKAKPEYTDETKRKTNQLSAECQDRGKEM